MRFLWTQENESIYSKRERRARIMLKLGAGALTVLIFLVFTLLFTKRVVVDNTSTLDTRKIMFLDVRRYSQADRHRFAHWMEYNNPTLISKPNSRYGYNSILRHNDSSVSVLPDLPFGDTLMTGLNIPGTKENIPKASGSTQPRSGVYRFDFQRFKQSKQLPVPRKYPLLTDFKGKVYADIVSALPEVKAAQLPAAPTVIKVVNSDNLPPEFRISESCGNRQLDLHALRELVINFKQLQLRKGQFILLQVFWRDF